MVQLWRCWTMVWWNWITLMEPIYTVERAIDLDLKNSSKDESIIKKFNGIRLKETRFFVGKTRWWFFHIVDALKAMFMVWWNWIALMELILPNRKCNWLGFDYVFKWWIDHNEDSMEQGWKKQVSLLARQGDDSFTLWMH